MPTMAIGSITNSKLLSYSQELVIPLTPARLRLLSADALALFSVLHPLLSPFLGGQRGTNNRGSGICPKLGAVPDDFCLPS